APPTQQGSTRASLSRSSFVRGMGSGLHRTGHGERNPGCAVGSGPTEHRRYVIGFDNGNETKRDLDHGNEDFSPTIPAFPQVRASLPACGLAEINYAG